MIPLLFFSNLIIGNKYLLNLTKSISKGWVFFHLNFPNSVVLSVEKHFVCGLFFNLKKGSFSGPFWPNTVRNIPLESPKDVNSNQSILKICKLTI